MRVRQGIPPEIMRAIKERESRVTAPSGYTRRYPYFELQGGKLAVSTVAVRDSERRSKDRQRHCLYVKKCAVHIIGESVCYVRDLKYSCMGGYSVDWSEEKHDETPESRIMVNRTSAALEPADSKYFHLFAHEKILNPDFLKQFPEWAHNGWDGCCDIFDYLTAYKANPQIEYISKIVNSKVAMSSRIIKLCAEDKGFIAFLKRNRREINNFVAETYTVNIPDIIDAYKYGRTIRETEKLKNTGWFWGNLYWKRKTVTFTDIILKRGEPFKEKVKAYLAAGNISPDSFNDYIRACKFLKVDLTDSKNLFPNDFNYWNDIRLNQYAAKKNSKLDTEIATVAQKYAALAGASCGYCVILAKSKGDLVSEGNALHHCVGRMDYDERIAKETSLIVFIRKAGEERVPFVTVEFSIGQAKVLQCYGEHDSRPPEEVREFVYNVWQPRAKKALNKIKKAVKEAA